MKTWWRITVALSGIWLLTAQVGCKPSPGNGARTAASQKEADAKTAALQKQVTELYNTGKYQEAIPIAEKFVQHCEKAYGPEHLNTANSSQWLAFVYQATRACAKAEPLYQRVLKIYEARLGAEHAETVNCLNNLATLYLDMREDAKAEPLCQRALRTGEAKLGPEHPYTATSLHNMALLYERKGEYAKAEPLYQRALKIREAKLGPEHGHTALTRKNLTRLHEAMKASEATEADALLQQVKELHDAGKYREVITVAEKLVQFRERVNGPEHLDTGVSLCWLARSYQAMGDYAKAESLFQRDLRICEAKLGPENPETATSLNNLASLYEAMGDYRKAEPLFQRALRIRESRLGPDHRDTASSLNNLALLYQDMSDYAKAEPLYLRALKIKEAELGPDHPDTATSLNNLALLYQDTGDYKKAEPLYLRALKIKEAELGPEHPRTATSLNNLAVFYENMGDYTKAEPLYQRALKIRESRLGPDHPDTATSLDNLASFYQAMGDPVKAEPLCQRALKIRESQLGPDHPDTAISLNSLASLYRAMGDYVKAEPLSQRALKIEEAKLGPDLPETARSLSNLALIYQAMGKYARAEPLYRRALKIEEAKLGPDHPYTARCLNNLAWLLVAKVQANQSLTYWAKNWAILEKQRRQILSFASERQQAAFVEQTLRGSMLQTISLAADHLPNNPEARRLALTVVLSSKGAILESLAERQTSVVRSGSPELKVLYDQCRSASAALSKAIMTTPKPGEFAAHMARIAELEKQKEAADEALARASAPFAAERQSRKVAVSDVARALPPGSALVEIVKYCSFRFDAKSKEPQWGDWNYVALVLRGGEKPDAPDVRLVPLGSAEKIEAAIRFYRKLSDLVLLKRLTAGLAAYEAASKDIATLVWKPIIPALGDCRKVYISPDGELAFVNFGALPGLRPGRFAIEDFDISYVTTGRDLLRQGSGQSNPPLLVGAPDYGARSSSAGVSFLPLPRTLDDVNTIASLLKQRGENPALLTGAQATEAAVRAAKHPRILHLATHGFFLPDIGWEMFTVRDDWRGFGGSESDLGGSARLWNQIRKENPMRRSGIALAGANDTFAGRREPGENDGILTAEEVIGMDLWGTQLVVISACESGLGESRGGEGVFGLRRAFALAGAQNLVMTLWSVYDKPTSGLMESFYRHLQTEGTPQRALLAAQREWIAKERSADREPHPFFWAAFVASGTGFGLEGKAK